jgi:GrpB-like predicted nucleotidyltransferase (UPF0157 family)
MDPPIHIVPYDPSWPALFATERELLHELVSPWLVGAIEHVGSTAVVGLSAKPIIDIMAGVESLSASADAQDALAQRGYHYAPYKSDVMHWFCKPSPQVRTHHLHLVPYQSVLWNERLAFRDLLRSDPAVALEYDALKRDLAARHRDDREAYTDAKSPFIERALGSRGSPTASRCSS